MSKGKSKSKGSTKRVEVRIEATVAGRWSRAKFDQLVEDLENEIRSLSVWVGDEPAVEVGIDVASIVGEW